MIFRGAFIWSLSLETLFNSIVKTGQGYMKISVNCTLREIITIGTTVKNHSKSKCRVV